MTPEELAAIRERDATLDDVALYASQEGRDRRALLAHMDALTEAVEGLTEERREAHPSEDHMFGYRECAQSVIALLRGTPQR